MNGHIVVVGIPEQELPFSYRAVGGGTGAKPGDVGRLDAEPHGVGHAGLAAGSGGALCVVFVQFAAAGLQRCVAGDDPGSCRFGSVLVRVGM